ncbi:hypothetical protein LTR66_005021 [Elasticomyces elasticus]|nr:hypothetical protein LTR28_007401 [Elasticomyces elasticus]KAK4995089.1 hypothetical protein LTR66_005021 [Elasticomyces elasticus]
MTRYHLFDRSGRLPFSIVFGLCRRSPADTDPRPLILDTTRSALDVPYALAHKLLTLHEHSLEDKQGIEVDLNRLTKTEGDEGRYAILPSPVNRKESKFEAFTIYQYHVDANSELALMLEPGKKYTIRLTSEDLGVKWYAFGERDQLISNEGKPSQHSGEAELVNSKTSAGHGSFTAVSSLPWPPKVLTHMRLCSSEASPSDSQTQQRAPLLELSVTNAGDRAISIQSRGPQRFLVPWGPFEPEEPTEDSRPRMTDPAESSGLSSLQIIDNHTGAVVRDAAKPALCDLYDTRADRRPKLSDLVTLKPGEPLARRVDVGKILAGLPDGSYSVRLQSRGAWWCFGTLEEIAEEGNDRVPRRLYKTAIPSLPLESEDAIELQVKGGKCVRNRESGTEISQ